MRISVRFDVRHDCGAVNYPERSAIVCDDVRTFSDGSRQAWIYSQRSVARAFAEWLAPHCDSCETRRAQWTCHNPTTGELEADVYPEFAADVLRKARRLRALELDFHAVSL